MVEATGEGDEGFIVVGALGEYPASMPTENGTGNERTTSPSVGSVELPITVPPPIDSAPKSAPVSRHPSRQFFTSVPPEEFTRALKTQGSLTMQDPKLLGHEVLFKDHVFTHEDWMSHTSFRRFLPEPIVMYAYRVLSSRRLCGTCMKQVSCVKPGVLQGFSTNDARIFCKRYVRQNTRAAQ